jgi:hypothetical protein
MTDHVLQDGDVFISLFRLPERTLAGGKVLQTL